MAFSITDIESVREVFQHLAVFKPLAMLLGLVYFISLIILDAWVAIRCKPARIWIPGQSLVISALTIQILSYLDIYLAKGDMEEGVFVGESARVVTCVLIGYLLPEMARAGAATDWRTLAALVLSLFTSEFYYLIYALDEDISHSKFYFYRLVINGVILLSIILLVLILICAILAGRTIRVMLAQRISVIQWDKSKKNEAEYQSVKNEEISWEKVEGEILESWFLARVCHPQYVIARSVLTSAVGLLVTICIVFLAILQYYLYCQDNLFFNAGGLSLMAWAVSWAFILIGETVILCRWFTAVVYFPRFFVKNVKLRQCTRLLVKDFWTRSVSELIEMYNLQKWSSQLQPTHGMLKVLVLRLATTMKIHYLFYLLWPLQVSLICFCKCCFFISELLFSFKIVWNCLLGCCKAPSQSLDDFKECKKVCMPGETLENLLIANEKTIRQAKKHFNDNKKEVYKCEKLVESFKSQLQSNNVIRFLNQLECFPDVAKHFPALNKNCMRMTTLSLLNVIINLLPFEKDVDKLNQAFEAYRQFLDLMSFVDNSDPQRATTLDMLEVIDIEADRVSVAVYKEFQSLLDLKDKKIACTDKPGKSALGIIKELQEEAKNKLNEQELNINEGKETGGGEEETAREEYRDSRNWSAIAASYSKYRVCKLILRECFDSENEIKNLMEYLYDSLVDVIADCLFRFPDEMVKTCREWAVKFEEEKIWDAMCAAGKFVGVMEMLYKDGKPKRFEAYSMEITSN